VELFAESEEVFFIAFKEAFSKLIAKGHTSLNSCSGSVGTVEQVEQAYEDLSCQDTHAKCATLAHWKCKRGYWLARCPRRCNSCPNSEGQSPATVSGQGRLLSMRSDDLTLVSSLYVQV
jgi:hypothetical protein